MFSEKIAKIILDTVNETQQINQDLTDKIAQKGSEFTGSFTLFSGTPDRSLKYGRAEMLIKGENTEVRVRGPETIAYGYVNGVLRYKMKDSKGKKTYVVLHDNLKASWSSDTPIKIGV